MLKIYTKRRSELVWPCKAILLRKLVRGLDLCPAHRRETSLCSAQLRSLITYIEPSRIKTTWFDRAAMPEQRSEAYGCSYVDSADKLQQQGFCRLPQSGWPPGLFAPLQRPSNEIRSALKPADCMRHGIFSNSDAIRAAIRSGHLGTVDRLQNPLADPVAGNNEAVRTASQNGHLNCRSSIFC